MAQNDSNFSSPFQPAASHFYLEHLKAHGIIDVDEVYENRHWISNIDGVGTIVLVSVFKIKVKHWTGTGALKTPPSCVTKVLIRNHDNIRAISFSPTHTRKLEMDIEKLYLDPAISGMKFIVAKYADLRQVIFEAMERMKIGGKTIPLDNVDVQIVMSFYCLDTLQSPTRIPPPIPFPNLFNFWAMIRDRYEYRFWSFPEDMMPLLDIQAGDTFITEDAFAKTIQVLKKDLYIRKKVYGMALHAALYHSINNEIDIASWMHNEALGLRDLSESSFEKSILVQLMINRFFKFTSVKLKNAIDNMMSSGLDSFVFDTNQEPYLYLTTNVVSNQGYIEPLQYSGASPPLKCAYCGAMSHTTDFVHCDRCLTVVYCNTNHRQRHSKAHSKECAVIDHILQILASTRNPNREVSLEFEEIDDSAQIMISEGSYQGAVRMLTKGVDKLLLSQPTTIFVGDRRTQLLSLLLRRAQCLVALAEQDFENRNWETSKAWAGRVKDDMEVCYEFDLDNGSDSSEMIALFRSYNDRARNVFKKIDFLPSSALAPQKQQRAPKKGKKKPFVKAKPTTRIINCREVGSEIYNHECLICLMSWSSFVQPAFCIGLPCGHATCVTCLTSNYKVCFPKHEQDFSFNFSCAACRKSINKDLFIALLMDFTELVDSFSAISKLIKSENVREIVGSLILTFDFDIVRIDDAIFNIASYQAVDITKDLDHEAKQEIYKQARKPLEKLIRKYTTLKNELHSIDDTKKEAWKTKYRQVQEALQTLERSKELASADVFERMNSLGQMGTEVDGKLKIDFHGLHVEEAKEKIEEFVLPILKSGTIVHIITGRGNHSASGTSVLSSALLEYFERLDEVRCRILKGNNGVLEIWALD
jgi:DNA-nicking Smr family endonuclease